MSNHRLLGGVLLVAGTTIGGAVLALPVSTGLAGFLPATILFISCWAYLTYTAFLLLEANLWMDGDVNLITMAERTLGRTGKALGWSAYLFLLYALTTAYLAIGGSFFTDLAEVALQIDLPNWVSPLPLLALFAYILLRGTRTADVFNRILMIGLGISFLSLLLLILPSADLEPLANREWGLALPATSIIVTAFGFHIVIPSLTTYMKRDLHSLKRALLYGSLLPLLLYLIWEAATLAVMPTEGPWGLIDAVQRNLPITRSLSRLLHNPSIVVCARFFEITAVLTTFTGVSLSLMDCLADALKMEKKGREGLFLCGLTLLPPLFFSLLSPGIFFQALTIAGAFGVTVLLGMLPALMVWVGRYHQFRQGPYRTPGGRKALIITILVSLFIIGHEIWLKLLP